MLLLRILTGVNVVEEEVVHRWLTKNQDYIIHEAATIVCNLPSRRILLELVLIMRLVLLLISAEHDFVLHHARVCLKMRQGSALAERPLSDVVHVAFHQGQILPLEAEHRCLRPNIAFACWMSNFTGAAIAGGKRFSEIKKFVKLFLLNGFESTHLPVGFRG